MRKLLVVVFVLATLLVPAAVAFAAPASTDDFTGPTLGGVWTVSPAGATSNISFRGASGGQLVVNVPGGSDHNQAAAPGAPGAAYRLLQTVTDVDFDVQMKVDWSVSEPIQIMGLHAGSAGIAGQYLRFDLYAVAGPNVKAYVGFADPGNPETTILDVATALPTGSQDPPAQTTIYLRLIYDKAPGVGQKNWTFQTSTNGTAWTTRAAFDQALTGGVGTVGLSAGNFGGAAAPEQTMLVDYFWNRADAEPADAVTDAAAPVLSSAALSGLGATTATVSWTSDEYSTSAVRYGTSPSLLDQTAGMVTLSKNHVVVLDNLLPNTTYWYRGQSYDPSSNQSQTTISSFSTSPDTTPPTALDDAAVVAENGSVVIDVLANDTDPEVTTLNKSRVGVSCAPACTLPSHGSVVANIDGTITYTNNGHEAATDSFTYQAGDGTNWSTAATVSVTVTPVNDKPVTVNDAASVGIGKSVTIAVLGNDSDPEGTALTAPVIVTSPTKGTIVVNADKSVTYTNTNLAATSDTFTYTTTDGPLTSDPATVTITISNSAPTAANDTATVQQGSSVTVTVLANDTDPDGQTLTPSIVSVPSHGTAVVNPDRTVTYTPTGGYTGSDSFTYRVSDGVNLSGTATVSITVNPRYVAATVGMIDPATGQWQLRNSAGLVTTFFYGVPGDTPIVGDWNCDGVDTPGAYRQSTGFVYLRNSNTTGAGEVQFFLGNPGDIPLAGDFNGDGCDTVSVYRPSQGRVFISNVLAGNNQYISAEYDYYFGNPGDKPFVGDFNADGSDTLGLHRESAGFVYFSQRSGPGVKVADSEFYYGIANDRLVAGDWGTVDGVDTVAIFRPTNATFYFRYSNTLGTADSTVPFGQASWLPVAGNFGIG